MKHLYERLVSPTPKFFKKLQKLGLSVAGLSTALLAIPSIPIAIVTVAGYLAITGGVITAIAQFAVQNTDDLTENPDKQ